MLELFIPNSTAASSSMNESDPVGLLREFKFCKMQHIVINEKLDNKLEKMLNDSKIGSIHFKIAKKALIFEPNYIIIGY
jgi:hypothetical protein